MSALIIFGADGASRSGETSIVGDDATAEETTSVTGKRRYSRRHSPRRPCLWSVMAISELWSAAPSGHQHETKSVNYGRDAWRSRLPAIEGRAGNLSCTIA